MKGFFRILAADSNADRIIGKYKKSEDVSPLKEKGWSMPLKLSDCDDTDCVFVRIKVNMD